MTEEAGVFAAVRGVNHMTEEAGDSRPSAEPIK